MAPEQTGRMNRSIDARSDLYSLGVIFYEMLTGSLPFRRRSDGVGPLPHRQTAGAATRARRRPGSPVSAIVMKLLAKTAEERYQTAAASSADLGAALRSGRPTADRRVRTGRPRHARPARHSREAVRARREIEHCSPRSSAS